MVRTLKTRKDLEGLVYDTKDTIISRVFGKDAAARLFKLYSSRIQYFLYAYIVLTAFVIPIYWLDLVPPVVMFILIGASVPILAEILLFFNAGIMKLLLKSFEWWLLLGFCTVFTASFCVIVDYDVRSFSMIMAYPVLVGFCSFDAQPRFKRKTRIEYLRVTMFLAISFNTIVLVCLYANLVPRLKNVTVTVGAVNQDVLGVLVSSLEALTLFFARYLYNGIIFPRSFAIVKAKVEVERAENSINSSLQEDQEDDNMSAAV